VKKKYFRKLSRLFALKAPQKDRICL